MLMRYTIKFLYFSWIATEIHVLLGTRTRAGSGAISDRGSLRVLWITIMSSITLGMWVGGAYTSTRIHNVPWLDPVAVARLVNADLIAAGLSPLAPQRAALAAALVMLAEFDRLAEQRADFAFESTLSGRTYASRLDRLTQSGYHPEIIFLRVGSPRLALQRIAARVKQGGHAVPKADVLRRYVRGWENFETLYRSLAHAWSVYDNSVEKLVLLDRGP